MTLDFYTCLKAFHVAAAFVFVGGVLGVAVFLKAGPATVEMARIVRRWDQRVTTTAMLLVWALGLSLSLMGGWFRDGWLVAKLGFVIVLSGVHGAQTARLRRMAGGISVTQTSIPIARLIIGCVVAITLLVIVKPF